MRSDVIRQPRGPNEIWLRRRSHIRIGTGGKRTYFFSKSAGFGSSTGTPFASQVPAAHSRSRSFGVACTMT